MFDIYSVNRCMNEKLSYHTFCVEMNIHIAVGEHGNEAGFEVLQMGFEGSGKREAVKIVIFWVGGRDLTDWISVWLAGKRNRETGVRGREVGVGDM